MSIEKKTANRKARLGRVFQPAAILVAAILSLLAVSSVATAGEPALKGAGPGLPLGEVLRPDGTLALPEGFRGSLDGRGWRSAAGLDQAPRFVPEAPAADGQWADIFYPPGPSGSIRALAVASAGTLYAGGYFTSAGGVSANNIARWDGANWSAMGSGVNGGVAALVVGGDGNLYAGGYFTIAGGVSANRIAMWDGLSWSALGSGMNGSVHALAVDDDGNLYAGGDFTTAGGVSANSIAMWDGANWSALGTGMGGVSFPYVYALAAAGDGNLCAGGYFTTAGGVTVNSIAKWDGANWSPLGDGLVARPPFSSIVRALAVDGAGNLYAGGYFTTAGEVSANSIAMWDGSVWSALGSGMGGYSLDVFALAADDDRALYAGGYFTTAGGKPSAYIALWAIAPEAAFSGSPKWGAAPLTVNFTNLSGGYFNTCAWDFGDGGTSTSCNDPSHQYSIPGAYTVSLTLSGLGGSDTVTVTDYVTVFEAASSDFSGSPLSGIAPLAVNFTNLSSGDYDSCSWLFGDGDSSTECDDPSHQYTEPGVYTVSLTVSGMGGSDTTTKTDYITVFEPAGSDFSGSPRSGAAPLTVNFTNLSSGDYDSCSWLFGDGGTSTECDGPSHQYSKPGVYTVSLTINGPGGSDMATKTDYVTVFEAASSDFSGSPLSGMAPLAVNFTNLSSGDYDSCSWLFGDGGSSTECDDPSHQYTGPGVFTVSLTVSGPGGSDMATKTDYVTVLEPASSDFSGSPRSGAAPLTVDFTNLSSGDYDTCSWLFGDGGSSTECNDPSHQYAQPGVYTVSLTVNGPLGSDTVNKTGYITVIQAASSDFSGSPRSGEAPLTVNFTNLSSGDYDSCSWLFGDGGASTECDNPSHQYAQPGVYTVSLTVSGPGGTDMETKEKYITVEKYVTLLPLLMHGQ